MTTTAVTATPQVHLTVARLRPVWLAAGVVAVAAAALAGLVMGPVALSPVAVLRHLGGLHSSLDPQQAAIVDQIRLPRVVLGLLVGSTLSLCGASYQGVFRNPLADPYLLGAAAGAGLGVTIVIVGAADGVTTPALAPLAAFLGALVAVALAYALGTAGSGRSSTALLILAGVAVASFFTAVQTYVQQRSQDTIRQVYSWILGRLSTAGWHEVLLLLPYAALTWIVLLVHRRVLDVLSVGDDEASALGVHARRSRLIVIIVASLGTAAAVSVSGLIGFVGIIVPHTVRLLAGRSHRVVLPLSLLFGGAFLCLADLLARTLSSPAEIPIGVITAFFGAPFFVLVLRSSGLDQLDLELERGGWLSIVGPNGAGKSTLLRYIAGLVPGPGDLRLDGRPSQAPGRRQRAQLVAYVPQAPVIPTGVRVLDYVLLGRTPHIRTLGVEGPRDIAAAHDALARLELVEFAGRGVDTLSGGERQRVLIARALAQESPLVLLDEPTTALDVGHQQQVLELIDDLRRTHELTVITTTHDLTLAGQYAERLVLLDQGRIVVDGDAHEVLTEDNLARYYGARVRIVNDNGRPVVVPLREVRDRP